ncbi:hypothetical protein [Caenispirillum bisanense]|uniref:hypothetical protein n=1 Tax=Caenispirillum bisanense TaxID=414052 RepID=UPI0031D01D7B
MTRFALAAALTAALALGGAAAPALAADPTDPLPEEMLGEIADARSLLDGLEEGGTPSYALAPAEDALECWAAGGDAALGCRDAFFARVVDATWNNPEVQTSALARGMGVDLWMQ